MAWFRSGSHRNSDVAADEAKWLASHAGLELGDAGRLFVDATQVKAGVAVHDEPEYGLPEQEVVGSHRAPPLIGPTHLVGRRPPMADQEDTGNRHAGRV